MFDIFSLMARHVKKNCSKTLVVLSSLDAIPTKAKITDLPKKEVQ